LVVILVSTSNAAAQVHPYKANQTAGGFLAGDELGTQSTAN